MYPDDQAFKFDNALLWGTSSPEVPRANDVSEVMKGWSSSDQNIGFIFDTFIGIGYHAIT